MVKATSWPLYPLEKDPVPILQEAVWASGQVWTGAKYLALTGIQSPHRPICSESLLRPTIYSVTSALMILSILIEMVSAFIRLVKELNGPTEKQPKIFIKINT
jgi:hypothetical protein